MNNVKDQRFIEAAKELGYQFDGEIKIGGNYTPLIQNGKDIYISGQIPRVDSTVVVIGRVGSETTLEQAQLAAKICVMRCLALLQKSLGSLNKVKQILRITVYTQCANDFTQLSEVSDGASDLLFHILGNEGSHTRTSIGVFQLPKDATVEIDMMVSTY